VGGGFELDFEREAIESNFVAVLCGEGCELRVSGVALVGDVGGEGATAGLEHALGAQALYGFDDLPGAQVVAAGLLWTVGVIQDYQVKVQLEPAEGLPGVFE